VEEGCRRVHTEHLTEAAQDSAFVEVEIAWVFL
jgi:hypothetical protein